jgi:hypothetical protein
MEETGMSAKTKTSSSKMASGHLGGLKFLEEGRIPIRILTVCQIRKKPVDPQVVERYRDLLAESEPPPIVVTRDAQGHNYVADGHHRVAAAMRPAGRMSRPGSTPATATTPGWRGWRRTSTAWG